MGLFDALLDNLNPQRIYDRRVAGWQDRQQGLLGSMGTIPGDMGPSPTDSTGTGLLGGQMTPMQYAQQTMLNPLYKDQGLSMVNSLGRNQAAMDMQMQEQGWSQNNMTAAQRHQASMDEQLLGLKQQQQQMDNSRREALGGYSGLSQRMQTMNTEAAAYEKNVMPYRAPIEYAERTNDMVLTRGGVEGMTPADDQALVVAFQKMMKQNESVMGEDFTTTVNNRGGMDYIEGMYNKVMNGAALTKTQRVDIVNLMNDLGDWYKPEYEKRRNTAERRALSGNLDPETYMQERLDFKRMERLKRPGEKDNLLGNMPSDVRPVRTGGYGRNR